jgi:hypothetical protein
MYVHGTIYQSLMGFQHLKASGSVRGKGDMHITRLLPNTSCSAGRCVDMLRRRPQTRASMHETTCAESKLTCRTRLAAWLRECAFKTTLALVGDVEYEPVCPTSIDQNNQDGGQRIEEWFHCFVHLLSRTLVYTTLWLRCHGDSDGCMQVGYEIVSRGE